MIRSRLVISIAGLFFLLISGCNSNNTETPLIPTDGTSTPTVESFQTPDITSTPTDEPDLISTLTAGQGQVPGLIAIFSEKSEFTGDIEEFTFSPDGSLVARADARVLIWDVNELKLVKELSNPHTESCRNTTAVFSSDGRYFAVSRSACMNPDTKYYNDPGYILVWDMISGVIVREMTHDFATITDPEVNSWIYSIPMHAIAFLPDGHRLVYSDGTTLDLTDLDTNKEPIVIDLGPEMFATQIAFPTDGRFIYVLRRWELTEGFENSWTIRSRIHIRSTTTGKLLRVIDYPEDKYWSGTDYELHASSLIMTNYENATIQVIDLVNEQVRDFPFCREDKVFSNDLNLMICVNPFSSAGNQGTSFGMTLWNTDTWRELGTSTIPTGEDYGTFDLAISPDGSRLIIEENSQISLWDVDTFFHRE